MLNNLKFMPNSMPFLQLRLTTSIIGHWSAFINTDNENQSIIYLSSQRIHFLPYIFYFSFLSFMKYNKILLNCMQKINDFILFRISGILNLTVFSYSKLNEIFLQIVLNCVLPSLLRNSSRNIIVNKKKKKPVCLFPVARTHSQPRSNTFTKIPVRPLGYFCFLILFRSRWNNSLIAVFNTSLS